MRENKAMGDYCKELIMESKATNKEIEELIEGLRRKRDCNVVLP